MKTRTAWLRDGCFGLMVHWIPPGPPPFRGCRITDPQQAVTQFDLDAFLQDVDQTGADWIIFTIGQNTGFYAEPNAVLDQFVGSDHASTRPLISEMAQKVKNMDKSFMVYLPADIYAQSPTMRRAFGWIDDVPHAEQSEFRLRYAQFVRAYSLRFGSRVDGWWFDGGATIWEPDPARLFDAARSGNPQAITTLNNGSLCGGHTVPAVAGQDFLAGEVEVLINGRVRLGRRPDAPLLDPVSHASQPPPGCCWHALVPIDCMWAHGNGFEEWMQSPYEIPEWIPGKMEPPLYSTEDLTFLVQNFKAAGGGVTFNVGIFQEGHLGRQTIKQLAEIAQSFHQP